MKRADETEMEWRERENAQMKKTARVLCMIAPLALIPAQVCGVAALVNPGVPILIWAALLLGAGATLWFAGQALHMRAALERMADRR